MRSCFIISLVLLALAFECLSLDLGCPSFVKQRYQHLIYNGYPCGVFNETVGGRQLRFLNSNILEIRKGDDSVVQSFSYHYPYHNESLRQIVVDKALTDAPVENLFREGIRLSLSASLDTIFVGDETFILHQQELCSVNVDSFLLVRSFLPYSYHFADDNRTLTVEFIQPNMLTIENVIPSHFQDIYQVSMVSHSAIVIDSLVSSSRKDIPLRSVFRLPYRTSQLTTTHSVFPLLQRGDTIYVSPDQKRLWVSYITFDASATSECRWVKSKYDWDAINREHKKVKSWM